jgi:hypothetical protein
MQANALTSLFYGLISSFVLIMIISALKWIIGKILHKGS